MSEKINETGVKNVDPELDPEDARMFMMMFKIDQIRAMITCIRICKVLMRQLILENFPKIELGIDKGVLQYNGGLMLKSGFIE